MTNEQILQRVYIHFGSEEQTGLVEPIVLAMADLAYIDLARMLIDTDAELAKKLISENVKTVSYSTIAANVINLDNDPAVLRDGMTVTINGTGLTNTTVYYIINSTPTSVQLSTTPGGTVQAVATTTGATTITTVGKWENSRYLAPPDMLFHTQKPVLRLELNSELCYQLQDRDKLNMLGSTVTNNYYALEGKTFYVRSKPVALTFNGSTDVFNWTNNPLVNGNQIMLSGSVPQGFTAHVPYFVIARAANTFQLSATSGGAAITSTDTGTAIPVTAHLASGDSNLTLRYYKIPTATDVDEELTPLFLDLLFQRLNIAMQSNAMGGMMKSPSAAALSSQAAGQSE